MPFNGKLKKIKINWGNAKKQATCILDVEWQGYASNRYNCISTVPTGFRCYSFGIGQRRALEIMPIMRLTTVLSASYYKTLSDGKYFLFRFIAAKSVAKGTPEHKGSDENNHRTGWNPPITIKKVT